MLAFRYYAHIIPVLSTSHRADEHSRQYYSCWAAQPAIHS